MNDIRGMAEYNSSNLTPIIYSIRIQLGFALAFIAIAMVVTKAGEAGARHSVNL